eukprot:594192-Rhodomonas_salina.2
MFGQVQPVIEASMPSGVTPCMRGETSSVESQVKCRDRHTSFGDVQDIHDRCVGWGLSVGLGRRCCSRLLILVSPNSSATQHRHVGEMIPPPLSSYADTRRPLPSPGSSMT